MKHVSLRSAPEIAEVVRVIEHVFANVAEHWHSEKEQGKAAQHLTIVTTAK